MWQASTIFLTSWVLMTVPSSVEQVVVSVVVRDNATLSCNSFPITATSWFGPDESGQRIRYTSEGQTLILDSVPQRKRLFVQVITSSAFNASSLTIANAMKTDANTYTCSTNRSGDLNITFSLQVTDPNVTVYVTEGTQSMLTCPLTPVINNLQWLGPPNNTVYNARGTTRLNSNGLPADFFSRLAMDPNTGALTIDKTRRSDDNLYKCNVGGPTNYVQLTVLVSPQDPVITNITEEIKPGRRVVWAKEDSQVTLVCQVRGGNPQSSVRWLRGGMTGPEVPSINSSQHSPDGTYDITSVVTVMARRYEDRVMYICLAEHITWTSPKNTSVELYLNLKPSEPMMSDPGNLQENATLYSTCSVTGCRPAATIMWSGAGTFSPATSIEDQATETFNVTSAYRKPVTRQDNGAMLQCTVTHPALTTSLVTSRNISILFPPTNVSITNNREVTAGDKLILRCTTGTSNPIANISWMNSTSTLTGELSAILEQPGQYGGKICYQNLTITPTRYMDGNSITCLAKNPQVTVPSVNDSVILNVMYNPIAVISNGSPLLVKEGVTNLTMVCVSESKPQSSFTWIKDTVNLKMTVPRSDNRDTYTIVQLNRTHYGEYSCIASNGISPNGQANASLHVQFSPIVKVAISPNVTITEGKGPITVQCSASSKPISYFTLRKEGLTNAISEGPGSQDNHHDYIIQRINRTYTGIYSCTAINSVMGPEDETKATVELVVQYPPDVIVFASNVTANDVQARLVCIPHGVPDRYTFSTWQHVWPGYNTTLRFLPSTDVDLHNATLDLKSLTYQDSGNYLCGATNGIKAAETQEDVITQMVYVLVKAPPKVLKIPMKAVGGIGSFIAIQLDYYSNVDAGHVTLQHSNTSKLYQADSVEEIQIDNLPVYSHYVPAKVFRGHFNISIDKKEDFGDYTVNVTNSIGFDVITLEIIPEHEPGKPYNFSFSNIQKTQITLSWYPGFHGGFDQTFVIQISMDNISWQNASLVPGRKGEDLFNTTITELKPNTIYYFRIYAFNVKGNGELADGVISGKTELEESTIPSAQINIIIGGAVGGGVAALVLTVVVILFLRRRTSLSENNICREHTKRKRPESGLVDNPVYDTSDPLPGSSAGSTVAEYAVVLKPKKTATKLEDPSNVYAQVDKKIMKKMKEAAEVKQGKVSRGDIYENADLTRKTANPGDLYENSGPELAKTSGQNVYEDPGATKSNGLQVNKEGLLYADFMLDLPTTKNGKLVIRGKENRTLYAEIAYGKRGELLPDSDDEQQKTADKEKTYE